MAGYFCKKISSQIFVIVNRVWKEFCMIWGLAVIWENKIHSAVICEFYLNCDAGFALSVVKIPFLRSFFLKFIPYQ